MTRIYAIGAAFCGTGHSAERGNVGNRPFWERGRTGFVDTFADQTPMQRLETIGAILAPAAVPADRWPPHLWDTEVIAAAAVFASNVSGEEFDTDPGRTRAIADYLARPLDLPRWLLPLSTRSHTQRRRARSGRRARPMTIFVGRRPKNMIGFVKR